jgi:hypothetical protein
MKRLICIILSIIVVNVSFAQLKPLRLINDVIIKGTLYVQGDSIKGKRLIIETDELYINDTLLFDYIQEHCEGMYIFGNGLIESNNVVKFNGQLTDSITKIYVRSQSGHEAAIKLSTKAATNKSYLEIWRGNVYLELTDGGLGYGGDYSNFFGEHSLVDLAYVNKHFNKLGYYEGSLTDNNPNYEQIYNIVGYLNSGSRFILKDNDGSPSIIYYDLIKKECGYLWINNPTGPVDICID